MRNIISHVLFQSRIFPENLLVDLLGGHLVAPTGIVLVGKQLAFRWPEFFGAFVQRPPEGCVHGLNGGF